MRVELAAEARAIGVSTSACPQPIQPFFKPTQIRKDQDKYWRNMLVPYQPYYAYEEILAAIAEPSTQPTPLLTNISKLVTYLGGDPDFVPTLDETRRTEGLTFYTLELQPIS